MPSTIPAIALTPGEPAGIGPDITVAIAQTPQIAPIIVYASADVLYQRASALKLPLALRELAAGELPGKALGAGELYIRHLPTAAPVIPGQLNPANSRYVVDCLSQAARDCLAAPTKMALVTGAIQKSAINDAGIRFSGHTEWLQELAGVNKVVMMLATSALRVALVTTHLPLRQVPDAITRTEVQRTLEIVHTDLQKYFTDQPPRIMVCGLNPHAGEGGHLGREEIEIIEPVMRALRQQGLDLTGPLPADTGFTPEKLAAMDVAVAMYHDQGLPVLKAQGFGEAINITLGLPFVRTSVDHGTALPLAASGAASHASLQLAIDQAIAMLAHAGRHAHA